MSASVLGIELSYWQETGLRSLGILAAVLLPAGTFVYLFLFKMVSFMQSRLGPMESGPFGSLQLLAEVGKFIQKEDIVPEQADRKLFKLAPYLVVSTVLLVYLAVPFGPQMTFVTNFEGGIFYVLAVSSISALGVSAATESTTMMSMAPERISMSAISSACSPVSGWETSSASVSTPSARAYSGSSACSASTKAAMPPARCASAIACRATVVLPEDSGP